MENTRPTQAENVDPALVRSGAAEQTARTPRRRLIRFGIAIFAAGALFCGGLWLTTDTSEPDESIVAINAPAAQLRPEDNGYVALESLTERIRQLDIANAGRAWQHLPERYDAQMLSVADQILGLETVAQLPSSIESVLNARGFQPPRELIEPALERVWLGTRDVASLLRLHVQRSLFFRDAAQAEKVAGLTLRFCQLIHDRTDGFFELGVANASQKEALRPLLAGLDARLFGQEQLRAMAALPPGAPSAERLLRAVAHEYRLFVAGIERQSSDLDAITRGIAYHRNRTRQAWLDAVRPVVISLRAGDVAAAHRSMLAAEGTRYLDRAWLRNSFGMGLIAPSLIGLASQMAAEVEARAQLARVRERADFEARQQTNGGSGGTHE